MKCIQHICLCLYLTLLPFPLANAQSKIMGDRDLSWAVGEWVLGTFEGRDYNRILGIYQNPSFEEVNTCILYHDGQSERITYTLGETCYLGADGEVTELFYIDITKKTISYVGHILNLKKVNDGATSKPVRGDFSWLTGCWCPDVPADYGYYDNYSVVFDDDCYHLYFEGDSIVTSYQINYIFNILDEDKADDYHIFFMPSYFSNHICINRGIYEKVLSFESKEIPSVVFSTPQDRLLDMLREIRGRNQSLTFVTDMTEYGDPLSFHMWPYSSNGKRGSFTFTRHDETTGNYYISAAGDYEIANEEIRLYNVLTGTNDDAKRRMERYLSITYGPLCKYDKDVPEVSFEGKFVDIKGSHIRIDLDRSLPQLENPFKTK